MPLAKTKLKWYKIVNFISIYADMWKDKEKILISVIKSDVGEYTGRPSVYNSPIGKIAQRLLK